MKVTQLKLNPQNPRKIAADQLDRLMRSISSFPEMMRLRPIVYDPETMHVLGGNQRLIAIRKLGMKEIPDEWAIAATDLTPEQKKEFVLRDNVQLGDWDFELLSAEFAEFDLEEMGMDMPEIEIEEPLPDELIGSNRDKKPTLTITFTSDKELIDAEIEIGELLKNKYPNANWSVSSGEI